MTGLGCVLATAAAVALAYGPFANLAVQRRLGALCGVVAALTAALVAIWS